MDAVPHALAALLVAGHALGDFVFQSQEMIRRKERFRGVLVHGGVVALCQAAMLAPFFSGPALAAVGAIGVTHVLVDAAKTALSRRMPSRNREWFVLDQLAHLAVLAAAWLWLGPRVEILGAVPLRPALLVTVGVLVSTYAFNTGGMAGVVVYELERLKIAPNEDGPSVGRVIGVLERLLAVTLILLDHWEALGLLLAAKSLARFKDLDERERAEYYLVGTLVSLLGASVSALAAKALLGRLG